MRKLKDLKENEFIYISNKKEAKYFKKIMGWDNIIIGQLVGSYIMLDAGMFFRIEKECVKDIGAIDTFFKASDFIKPKKSISKRLKSVEKKLDYLDDFVANMQPKPSLIDEYMKSREPGIEPNEIEVVDPKEQIGNSEHLEIGKWYKCNDPIYDKMLAFVLDVDNVANVFRGYGFDSGGVFSYPDGFVWGFTKPYEATKEEVEAALKAHGLSNYKIDNKVKCATNGVYEDVIKSLDDLWFKDGKLWCGSHGSVNTCLFKDGKWAEVIEQEQEIDWNKIGKGYLIESEDIIVMYSGRCTSTHFEGTILKVKHTENYLDLNYHLGMTVRNILKSGFNAFKGVLTFKNE